MTMTYDDGIVKIYSVVNTADAGDKPKEALEYKTSFYFSYDNLGVTRYYEALRANQLIEAVINVQWDLSVKTTDVAVMEDGTQYRIAMSQPQVDDDGLRFMRLSLERINNEYEYQSETETNS